MVYILIGGKGFCNFLKQMKEYTNDKYPESWGGGGSYNSLKQMMGTL